MNVRLTAREKSLYSVMRQKKSRLGHPFKLGAQSLFKCACRHEPEFRASRRRVGVRIAHVPRLRIEGLEFQRPSRDALDELEDLTQSHAGPTPNIVDSPGRSASPRPNRAGDG